MSTLSPYIGDGSTTQFDITFTYRDSSTVKVSVGGVDTSYTFVNASRVELATAPASGVEVRVYRQTDVATPAVDFTDGAIIRAEDLDDAVAQPRDRVEEIGDQLGDLSGRALRVPPGEAGPTLPSAAERANKYSAWDPNGAPIVLEGTGVDLALRSSLAGHGLILTDFGTGLGAGNAAADTAAWQAALNALATTGEKRLIVPVNEYLINATLLAPANLNSVEIVAMGGYDGVRGPINLGLFTSLKWVGPTDATKAVVKFDQATGCVWSGISINCDYKAGYALQWMASSLTNGSVKNTSKSCSFHYALRDGIIVGEWGEPTAAPGQRQFFGNRFEDLTFYGCGYSGIHINEWNADQQIFDGVMTYLDDAAIPQPARNGIWFDSGGQYSELRSCQSGGQTIVPGEDWSGYMIRNQHADETATGGAHGLKGTNCWQEGPGGFYYGATSTEDNKTFSFTHCASYTNDPASRRSVYIDKGTSAQIPYTFDTCTFLSDVEIASSTFNKESLALNNCIFAAGHGVIDATGAQTDNGTFAQIGTTGNVFTVPVHADLVRLTINEALNGIFAGGVTKRGDRLTIVITQDATGGRTVDWAGSTNFSALPTIPQPGKVPGAKTTYTFISDGTVYYLANATPTLRGAMAKKSADQTAADYSAAPVIAWDAEVYDTEAIHDPTTNNSRFTVPAGVSSVELGATVALNVVDPNVIYSLALKKNGSTSFDGAAGTDANSVSNSGPSITVTSGPIPVVPGDYFEWQLYCADVSITVTAAKSNAWLKVLA